MGVMPATLLPLPLMQSPASSRLQQSASLAFSQAPPSQHQAAGPMVQGTLPAPTAGAGAGVLLGNGLAPLPPKPIKRTHQLEFVEMTNLLSKAWLLEEFKMEAQLRPQEGPVTDILLWVQCFATIACTLASAYPSNISKMMAYLATIIVQCHRDYKGLS